MTRWLAVVALVACSSKDTPSIARRELPGFSIELPTDDAKPDSLDYANGRIEILRASGSRMSVAVSWEPGGPLSREDLALLAKGVSGALEITPGPFIQVTGPNNTQVDTATATMSGDRRLLTSIVACGGRRLVVITGGPDVDALHGRIVASIVCHPEPAREAELGRPPLAIDLPTGWQPATGFPELTVFTNGNEAILLRAITGVQDDAAIPKVLTSLFQAMGAPITVHERAGDVYPLDGMLEGSHAVGWAMVRSCPVSNVIIIALAETQVRANDLAKLVREHARCLTGTR